MTGADPDPIPGDFDERLADVAPADVQVVPASRERSLIVQFTLDGEDAATLQRIAQEHGEPPGEIVRSLIRAASGA